VILYEYPFNERIRTYLRLEYLFDRLFFFGRQGDPRFHQIAVATLFDILDATERSDVKSAVMQDLERQRNSLCGLRGHPAVSQDALETMLGNMERVTGLLGNSGKTGQALRENEWLVSLRGRLAVPGGATQFDMPSYHAWQQKDENTRLRDIEGWLAPLMPLQEALAIVLRLIRESGARARADTDQGAYQQMLGGKSYQLLRVWIDDSIGSFPEISANKYMVWIRFSTQDGELKPQPITGEVSFQLALCGP
jgi:cell division protein ZapD